jgi:hypothetical protein
MSNCRGGFNEIGHHVVQKKISGFLRKVARLLWQAKPLMMSFVLGLHL